MVFPEPLEETLCRWGDALLRVLLSDWSTGKPIRWASDGCAGLGRGFGREEALTPARVRRAVVRGVLRPRAAKSAAERLARVRAHGEVFTPSHVCKRMTDVADEDWFCAGEEVTGGDFFFGANLAPTPLRFRASRRWQDYVRLRRLEITCGEAPFLTARYDAETGETIPWGLRYGLLDRKLRVLPPCLNRTAWQLWVRRAYAATYGYELQGDNLFFARCNLLLTFEEAHRVRWKSAPSPEALREIAEILARNLWQMDGLTGFPPGVEAAAEADLFENNVPPPTPCRVCMEGRTSCFQALKGDNAMKFDFIIGNPPYQGESNGDGRNFAPPIYHHFLESIYPFADHVEMIHPARFLFNAGSTPKEWNLKMLADRHLKVVEYVADSANFFPGTDIKGGVAITYRDTQRNFGAIDVFTPWNELNTIKRKVCANPTFRSLKTIVFSRTIYRLTDVMHQEHPEAIKCLSDGHGYDMASNIFQRLPELFTESKPNNNHNYIRIYGRIGTTRVLRWVRQEYVNAPSNFNRWKVFIPSANGSGALGEIISMPYIGEPLVGATETFISVGSFATRSEAEACLKYVKTKFARVMLGILKITQNGAPSVWRLVPLQDFTSEADIDWTVNVAEVDRQLYRKYGLSAEEVAFIESKVKEMA